MGTNYYVIDKTDMCLHCGHGEKELHIGKSSAGWNFSLHIIPELGLNTLDDWKEFLKNKTIIDEYGREIIIDELLHSITKREHPNGLRRAEHQYCSGHGDGTFDYISGEFS